MKYLSLIPVLLGLSSSVYAGWFSGPPPKVTSFSIVNSDVLELCFDKPYYKELLLYSLTLTRDDGSKLHIPKRYKEVYGSDERAEDVCYGISVSRFFSSLHSHRTTLDLNLYSYASVEVSVAVAKGRHRSQRSTVDEEIFNKTYRLPHESPFDRLTDCEFANHIIVRAKVLMDTVVQFYERRASYDEIAHWHTYVYKKEIRNLYMDLDVNRELQKKQGRELSNKMYEGFVKNLYPVIREIKYSAQVQLFPLPALQEAYQPINNTLSYFLEQCSEPLNIPLSGTK
ncbi:hypothetical protein MHO82_09870 [Vibrio sp. Of7-15]|uniref:hypothetical protein n=1 Tax=Vibrio sp. Of7-15 TaxID=2724879 RepID=UPI001EF1E1AB|nr:hypothetical protein [Vibrio sp. Of7-15]MCG7497174.1 hypothetical protein [Vibrio sp. Of7-15]